jgi:hypothetical protein
MASEIEKMLDRTGWLLLQALQEKEADTPS